MTFASFWHGPQRPPHPLQPDRSRQREWDRTECAPATRRHAAPACHEARRSRWPERLRSRRRPEASISSGRGSTTSNPRPQADSNTATDPTESALGLDDPGRDPAHDHAAVATALDVGREATEQAVEVLDRVRAAQRPVEWRTLARLRASIRWRRRWRVFTRSVRKVCVIRGASRPHSCRGGTSNRGSSPSVPARRESCLPARARRSYATLAT